MYYYNQAAGTTQWEFPTEASSAAPVQPTQAAAEHQQSYDSGASLAAAAAAAASAAAAISSVPLMSNAIVPVQQHTGGFPGGPSMPNMGMAGQLGPVGCNLFIFHVPNDWSDSDLQNAFAEFGAIVSCRIPRDDFGKARGFGFVGFDNAQSAVNAVAAMHGFHAGGKWLKVQIKKGEEVLYKTTTGKDLPEPEEPYVERGKQNALNPPVPSPNRPPRQFSQSGYGGGGGYSSGPYGSAGGRYGGGFTGGYQGYHPQAAPAPGGYPMGPGGSPPGGWGASPYGGPASAYPYGMAGQPSYGLPGMMPGAAASPYGAYQQQRPAQQQFAGFPGYAYQQPQAGAQQQQQQQQQPTWNTTQTSGASQSPYAG